ncbi:MAG: response regulator, partial [Desulfobacterales bacterium]|nr:response regulator [Desulfobacterales bacterium]
MINENEVKLSFTVEDTGIGITQEQIEKLFQSFSQADSSMTRKYGGTGLGLTISKHIVEMMRGEIHVKSDFGKGTTFHFTACFQLSEKSYESLQILPDNLKGLRALVVDDNAAAREIISETLYSFRFDVTRVSSGREAIIELEKSVKDAPFRLVIMDWKMPELNGIEATQHIKSNPLFSNLPHILMVTAYDQENIVTQAQQVGIAGFLTKPVNRSLLFDAILKIFCKDISSQKQNYQTDLLHENIKELKNIQGARILLVEDNEINRQIVREILELYEFYIFTANNGYEAVSLINDVHPNKPYDAILMDLQMPEMDGYEATKRIRTKYSKEELPIIALTAHAMITEKERCFEIGVNDYVTKPIDPKKLFEALIHCVKPGERILPQSLNRHDNEDVTFPDHLAGID